MSRSARVPQVLVAGAIAGALVLGIAGRLVTAGVALLTGRAMNLGLKGVVEVVVLGALVGAVGGVLLRVLRIKGIGTRLARGAMVGLVLFLCSLGVASATGRLVVDLAYPQPITLCVVMIVCVAYGVCADRLIARSEGVTPGVPRSGSLESST